MISMLNGSVKQKILSLQSAAQAGVRQEAGGEERELLAHVIPDTKRWEHIVIKDLLFKTMDQLWIHSHTSVLAIYLHFSRPLLVFTSVQFPR